jgi:hypothetical protein
MTKLARNIRDFFISLNGSLLVKEYYVVHEELVDTYDSIYKDLEMKSILEDKKNLHGDFLKFKKDFKTSVKKYKVEVLNG